MLNSIIGIKCSDTPSGWISSCPTPEAQLQLNVPHGQISKYEDFFDGEFTL